MIVTISFIVISAFAIAEGFMIWALLNRLLQQNGIAPIRVPEIKSAPTEPKVQERVPLWRIPVDG